MTPQEQKRLVEWMARVEEACQEFDIALDGAITFPVYVRLLYLIEDRDKLTVRTQ